MIKPAAAIPTFGEEADKLIEAMAPSWRNAKHLEQWKMTLNDYCKAIRSIPVYKITTEDVLKVLRPHR